MYLNKQEIQAFCDLGYMKDYDESCINTASLDVRLGDTIMIEKTIGTHMVDYKLRDKLQMHEIEIPKEGVFINPGAFFLAHTIEKCDFPDDVAALFRIKSSMGRIGLEHLDAGWVDPGFNGSLTLEFKNMTQNHVIRLQKGDRIGQLVFLRGKAVSENDSYRTVGNYNGFNGISQAGYK